MNKIIKKGIFFAILAAALYALNSPISKILLSYMPSTLMAGFLYIGAGIGMGFIALGRKVINKQDKEQKITKKELPYTILMIILDIIAPIFLLLGLKYTTAANVSLLNNFEIIATSLIALMIFKEKISKRLWLGIIFILLSCILLSFENISSLKFSYGSLFIILACISWGFENNCTRKMSSKDPLQIVLLKGIFSGLGSIIIGFCIGEKITHIWAIFAVLGIGFISYGLSIFVYIYAQRILGAARTTAYYAVSPFIGAILSLILFTEVPSFTHIIAFILMIIGGWLSAKDEPIFKKRTKS